MTVSPSVFAEYFGGEKLLGRPCNTWADLGEIAASGVPREAAAHFQALLAAECDFDKLDALDQPFRLLFPPQKTKCLGANETATLMRFLRVFLKAESVIGTRGGTIDFMFTSHFDLDGNTPANLVGTEIGAIRIESLLDRAEQGFPV